MNCNLNFKAPKVSNRMSSKLFNPLENPPNSSSSDEEYEEEAEETVGNSSSEEEEEEEETDSEPETEREEPVKSPVPSVVKKNQDSKKVESSATKKRASETDASSDVKTVSGEENSSSEEEEEEETDSGPETETREPVKNHEPTVAKKNVGSPATKKRASEADASSKDAKRVKTVSGEETKKNYFQRVWSEEDEIAVLQGIIDYNIETGASPYGDTNVFYELVKKSISFDVSKTQFMEKIRGLKKKFENNLGRGKKKKNGEDPSFSKPHDRKAFDLSKLVWGDNGIMARDSSAVKPNGKSRKSKNVESRKQEEPMKEQEFVSIVESVARFGVDGLAAQQGWNRLASEEKKRFEEQWKALQIKEFKFFSQKSGFIHQVVTKMAEAFRPNP